MSVYPRWRVRFDPPHETCIVPGLTRASLLANISRDVKILNDPTNGQSCWQDPLTGVLMLRPNIYTERVPEAFTPLSEWRHRAGFWRQSLRAMGSLTSGGGTINPSVISLSRPSDASGAMALPELEDVTLAAISLASQLEDDALIPALESSFIFPEDAGFVVYARMHTDTQRRFQNWFGVAWGRYFLHVSPLGKARLYRWNGANTVPPVLVGEKDFGASGVAGTDHNFYVLPIPGRGICLYHSLASTKLITALSSADASAPVGFLFEVPAEEVENEAGNYFRINTASKVTIYLNKSKYASHDIAFAHVKFPTRGAFAGEMFDLERARTTSPDSLNVQVLPTRPGVAGYITKQLLGPDPTATWTTASKQARFGVVLDRVDEYHTPFVYSTYVAWAPIRDLRSPGIVEMDAVELLAHTQEDTGRWEGKAVVRAWSTAAKRLIERGDAYHIVERQDAEGGAWSVEYGGIARVEPNASAHIINGRFEYQATWSLGDMTTRLKEASCLWKTAFDDLTLLEATGTVLQALGEPVLTSAPARFSSVRIPAAPKSNESNWQNGPKVGEDGYEIIRRFLAFGRRKETEPRLVHTWGDVTTGTGGRWDIEDKPRLTSDESTWSLTDKITEEDLPTRRVGIRRDKDDASQLFTFSPVPPGATILQVYGVEGSQPSSAKYIPGRNIRNHAGLNTPASLEYLGRTVTSYPLISGVGDPAILDRIARAVYDLSCRWKSNLTVELTRYVPALGPAVRVSGIRYEVYSEAESAWVMRELQWRDNPASEETRHYLWVRRRRIVQTHCQIPAAVFLDLSTQWESGIDD